MKPGDLLPVDATEARVWEAVALSSAALAGIAARKAVVQAWRLSMHREPPDNPASPDVSWREAVLWTAAVGLAIGVGRLVGRRGAAAGWRRVTGRDPAGL